MGSSNKIPPSPLPQNISETLSSPNHISLFMAICVVVANMIGTGVFTSLGFQVIEIKSGFAIYKLV